MGIIVYLIVGGLIGWVASLLMKTDGQQGIFLNVIVGIIGSFLAGVFLGGGIGEGVSLMSVLYSLLGAVVLLAIVNLVRKGRVR